MRMKTTKDKLNFFTLFSKEAPFREVLIELLPDFGFTKVIQNHGPNELGKDVIGSIWTLRVTRNTVLRY